MGRDWKSDWLPAVLAAAAFLLFAAAFVLEALSYQRQVVGWALKDLDSRTRLTAANLDEPLRTQDIRRIREIGEALRREDLRLVVQASGGGRFYDSVSEAARRLPRYWAETTVGEYRIRLGVSHARVHAPFRRALMGFALAGLVGMAGVLLFFFVTYRQRVRIRELRRLEAFRRDFIADVSHEIKTPLTGILGAVDLLEGDSPILGLIRDSSRRLNALVQSILDLARLEREADALHCVETDLADLARDVALRHGRRCDAAAACVVRCDPQLVGQALENLVVNAERHAGTDDIVVRLETGAKSVRLAVEDRGIGIPAEHAERIFERFHRVDPARSGATGGAGLGLAIVRRIARLHGGEATFERLEPTGSRFVISLPLDCSGS